MRRYLAEPVTLTPARRWRAFSWLCEALRLRAGGDTIQLCWPEDPDETAALIVLAGYHMVTPALAPVLGGNITLPPPVADYLEAAALLNRDRNTLMLEAVGTIAASLARAGIDAVFLKGGANLASGLYSDPAMRLMGDLDILVPPEQAACAATVLGAEGFADIDAPPRLVAGRLHHLPMQRHALTGVGVEVHHQLLPERLHGLLDSGEALRSAVSIDLAGQRVAILAPPWRILLNVVHDQITDHAFARRTCELRQSLDLALLWNRHADSLDRADLAAMLPARIRPILGHGLALAGLLGAASADQDEIARARHRIREGVEYPRTHFRRFVVDICHRLTAQPRTFLNLLQPAAWGRGRARLLDQLRRPLA